MTRSGSETVDDGGVELVCAGKMEIEAAATFEPLRAQGTRVKATCGMKYEGVVLEFTMMGGGEDAAWAVERRQDRRHTLVGESRCF